MNNRWVLLAAFASASCARDPGTGTPEPTVAVAPTPSAAQSADASPPPLALAPVVASAPRAEREARVLSLLRGEVAAGDLPEVATEAGEALDPGLREELAPRKKTKLELTNLEISGALTAEACKRPLESAKPGLRSCYGRGLARNPILMGSVGLELTVAADGRITQAKNAGSDLPDSAVVECVVRRMSAVALPPTDAGTTVIRLRARFSPD